MGRWGVAVRGGDCAGISYEAEGRATQWSRGAGRRLRVDGDFAFVCLMLVGRLLVVVLKIIGGGFACAILAWCSQTGV